MCSYLRILAAAMVLLGCRAEKPSSEGTAAAPKTQAAPAAVTAFHGSSAPGSHDPAHPPIDCPLRKQGIEPDSLRPFEDTARYIAFLERPDRAVWQKPDAVVAALGLKGSETLFDLGAGSGYFSLRFAKALPQGRVIAADTEAEMVRHVHHRAMTEGVRNVEAKFIQAADPEIASDADWVFICDVLHHVADRPTWFRKLAAQMRSGSRLALIEFREGQLPEGPPEGAKIPRAALLKLGTQAGLVLDSERRKLLPYQTFLIFRKP